MTAATRSRRLAQIFLVAAFGAVMCAAPASAQKQGGSITVGLEVDILGFDPLKVGVFDTAAETAAAAIFDTLTTLDDKGEAQPKLLVQAILNLAMPAILSGCAQGQHSCGGEIS